MIWMKKKNDQRLETKSEKALKTNAMRWIVIWWMERMKNYVLKTKLIQKQLMALASLLTKAANSLMNHNTQILNKDYESKRQYGSIFRYVGWKHCPAA